MLAGNLEKNKSLTEKFTNLKPPAQTHCPQPWWNYSSTEKY